MSKPLVMLTLLTRLGIGYARGEYPIPNPKKGRRATKFIYVKNNFSLFQSKRIHAWGFPNPHLPSTHYLMLTEFYIPRKIEKQKRDQRQKA